MLIEIYFTETEDEVKKQLLITRYSTEENLGPDDQVIIKALEDKNDEIQFLGTLS